MRAPLVLATLGLPSLASGAQAATVTVGPPSLATQSSFIGCSG